MMGALVRMGTLEMENELGELRRNWGWLLAFGIGLLALGIAACAVAGFTTIASVLVFGWLVAIGGALQIIHAFSQMRRHGFFLNLLLGILYLVVGLEMLARPLVGAMTLTLLLSAFLMVSGISRLAWSASFRLPGWGWGALSGIISAVLGFAIAADWPSTSLWILGLFIGIEMIFSGWASIMLATLARGYPAPSLSPTVERPSLQTEPPRKVS